MACSRVVVSHRAVTVGKPGRPPQRHANRGIQPLDVADTLPILLDRALRTELSAPSELGRLADVFGRVREERSG